MADTMTKTEREIRQRIKAGLKFVEEFSRTEKPPSRRELLTAELKKQEDRESQARRRASEIKRLADATWSSLESCELDQVAEIVTRCDELKGEIDGLAYIAQQAMTQAEITKRELANLLPEASDAFMRLKARAAELALRLKALAEQPLDPRTEQGRLLQDRTLELAKELNEIREQLRTQYGYMFTTGEFGERAAKTGLSLRDLRDNRVMR